MLAKARGLTFGMKKKSASSSKKSTAKKSVMGGKPVKPSMGKGGNLKSGGKATSKPGMGGASIPKSGRRSKSNGFDL
jgi:hypothetical protein